MTGTMVTLVVFLGLTIALGFLSGKVTANTRWAPPVKTAIHVTFVAMVVVTLLFLLRVVARLFVRGGLS